MKRIWWEAFDVNKIYNRFLKERTTEIQEISDEINYDDLIYYFKGPSSPVSFTECEDPSDLYDKIKNDDETIKTTEEEQKKFKWRLGELTSGNPEHKSANQPDTIKNTQNLYNARQKIIGSFNDNPKIRSEVIYEAKQDETKGTGLKILTHKQLLQRLLIALAQVKAGNNWENLLNKIRKIVLFILCINQRKSLKKSTVT